jgi:hypothetical protein
MKKHGFIPAYPFHVRKARNGKYIIIGGHNRFEAAKSLNIPVKYIVTDDTATIHELEKASKSWSLADFLHSYTRQGISEYQYLSNFHRETKIPINECIHLLQDSRNLGCKTKSEVFKNGNLKITDPSFALKVADVVLYLSGLDFTFARHVNFVRALKTLMSLDEFLPVQFKHKIEVYPQLLKKQASTDAYMENIEKVYNYKEKVMDKISLVFNARRALMQKRQESVKKMVEIKERKKRKKLADIFK